MTPERYRRIDQIFQTALELDPESRTAFIDEACAEDSTLRGEIRSLLASDRGGLSFIDGPALDFAARLLASDEPELDRGQRIDRYEILSSIGSGGMGEVYLAYDEKLNRNIALKLLPSDFTGNRDRVRRFQQEARAASALNHPNIITIHEIGEVDKRHFIATEFVDGQTLRQRLRGQPLDLHEALDIAIQVCSALSAAHRAGIVHRDIKPENIMLRSDGYVKVLDFGLAKLIEQSEQGRKVGSADIVDVSSGLVMGTVKYMSPEQAQGLAVDQRSDIFSLGVVLYEMLTGHGPYRDKRGPELINAILTQAPTPLTDYPGHTNGELQRIISKSLSKQTTGRYQSADELLLDLKRLKERRTSLLSYVASEIKQHKAIASLVLAISVMGALAAVSTMYKFFKSRRPAFANFNVTKLTNFDDAWAPSISADGKHVAYVKGTSSTGAGKNSLWLKAVGTTSDVPIVPATEGYILPTSFLPDDGHIAYRVQGSTFVIPTAGGSPTRLPLKEGWITFSPVGKRLAYVDNRLSEGKTVVVVANSDGTDVRDISTRQAPDYYWTTIAPSWSPDGTVIACVGQNGNESFPHVFAVDLETKTEKPITAQRWNNMSGLAWLPDMSGLLVVASEETSSILQLWEILYPSGEARRITNDTVNYVGLSLSKDGKALVTTRSEAPSSIWVMPVETTGGRTQSARVDKARQINVTNFSGHPTSLSWTPDGRIVYMSEETGNAEIWSMNADGSDRKQLTTDPHWDAGARVSPDGRYIVFMSNRPGAESIWRMDIDGRNQTRLTRAFIERDPAFSPDGKWVFFAGWETGKATIWKVPVEGGQAAQVITDLAFHPLVSPNGTMLLYDDSDSLVITGAQGGSPMKGFKGLGEECQWSPDGRALTCLRDHDNVWNLWEQPLDGSEPRQLTNFPFPGVSRYAFSRDGKQLAVTRTKFTSDIILIREGQ